MPGLDDLIGSLQKAQGSHGSGGGLDDVLGGMLGGAGSSGGAGSGGGGLGDILGGVLGGGSGGGLGGILGSVLGGGGGDRGSASRSGGAGSLMATLGPLLAVLLANGGLKKILGGMNANGLSAQADSWVGTGENQQIGADEVRRALGDGQIEQVAQHLGVDGEQASQVLAQILPGLVNTVTPDGEEPSEADLDKLAETLKRFAS
jgi:uncharacterized protein YidB (DUF937 family)